MSTELNTIIECVKQKHSNDYLRLYSFASAWVKLQMKPFTSEDIKKAFYEAKNEPPDQVNVFGAVVRNLSKEGLMYEHGFDKAKIKAAHSRILRLWISKEYRLKQQKCKRMKSVTAKTILEILSRCPYCGLELDITEQAQEHLDFGDLSAFSCSIEIECWCKEKYIVESINQ